MKLAHFLKKARLSSGLSQGKVAELLGYSSPQFISNWERGLSHPPIDVLRKIAKLYHTSDDAIFELLLEVTLEDVKNDLRRRFYKSTKNKKTAIKS